MENKEMILTRLDKMYSDDYTCELTQLMDKYLFNPINERLRTYLYDPEYYLRKNSDGKYIEELLGEIMEVKDTTCIPIRFPGATRGHVKVDTNQIILEIVLYDETCFGTSLLEQQYDTKIKDMLNKFIGRKIVVKNS